MNVMHGVYILKSRGTPAALSRHTCSPIAAHLCATAHSLENPGLEQKVQILCNLKGVVRAL